MKHYLIGDFDGTLAYRVGGWTAALLEVIRHHLPFGPHIGRIFNSAETGYEKPHPQAFRHALAAPGEIAAVWMIGDSLQADIAGAAMVGSPGILVRTHHPDAQYCCSELSQVSDLLNRTCEGGFSRNIGLKPTMTTPSR